MRDKENEIQLAHPIDDVEVWWADDLVRVVEVNGSYRFQYRDNLKDDWRWVVLQTERVKVLARLARVLGEGL